ncbi:Fc.00g113230.m01.CDS01 [Cosmosporella sp. VM-42]
MASFVIIDLTGDDRSISASIKASVVPVSPATSTGRAAPDGLADEEQAEAPYEDEASGVSSPVAGCTDLSRSESCGFDYTPISPLSTIGDARQTPTPRGRSLNRHMAQHERNPSPLSLLWVMRTYPISPPTSPERGRSRSPGGFCSPSPPRYRSRSPIFSEDRLSSPMLFPSRECTEKTGNDEFLKAVATEALSVVALGQAYERGEDERA